MKTTQGLVWENMICCVEDDRDILGDMEWIAKKLWLNYMTWFR